MTDRTKRLLRWAMIGLGSLAVFLGLTVGVLVGGDQGRPGADLLAVISARDYLRQLPLAESNGQLDPSKCDPSGMKTELERLQKRYGAIIGERYVFTDASGARLWAFAGRNGVKDFGAKDDIVGGDHDYTKYYDVKWHTSDLLLPIAISLGLCAFGVTCLGVSMRMGKKTSGPLASTAEPPPASDH